MFGFRVLSFPANGGEGRGPVAEVGSSGRRFERWRILIGRLE